jgi:phosphoglycerol transferase
MDRRHPVFRSFPLYAAEACVVAAIAWAVLGLGAYDLKVPFNYDGDSMVILMYIKGMLLNGWTFTIPQLSAPFGLDAAAFPIMSSFDWLIMKALSLFTSEPGLVLNLFWLLTLALSGMSATLALRLLGVWWPYAFAAGIVYAFLPFALMRNVSHLNLVYYLVPLLGMFAVHLANGLSGENDKLIRRVAYGACIAQGFDYVYYSFFAVLLFAFAAVVGYAGTRTRAVFLAAATAIGLVIGATSVNLSPGLYSWYSSYKPAEMDYKSPAEAEMYGAKIRKMIAPSPGNPVPFLARWGKQDKGAGYPNENENATARLGLAASAGFLVLLLVSLGVLRPPDGEAVLGRLAALALFTLLFITVGGFGAVFNLLLVPDIRAYNRFSVFLGFFALAGLAFALRAWAPRGGWRRGMVLPAATLLFGFSLYDQLLDCELPTRMEYDTQAYRADRDVATRLQAVYPAGASILELPLTGFPPAYHHDRMVSYDHLRPFLWSGKNLRWSWPSFSQRHRAWQDRLAAASPQGTVNAAVLSNFDAILVDRYAYQDDGKALITELEATGAVRQFALHRYVLLDLGSARRRLADELGTAAFARQSQEWLEPIRIIWGEGFYPQETTPQGARFRWSAQRSSLIVFNDASLPRKVRLDFDIASQRAGTVQVDSAPLQWRFDSRGQPSHASIEFTVAPGAKRTLAFRGNVEPAVAPGDPRKLYFNVENFAFTELASDVGSKTAAAAIREQQ